MTRQTINNFELLDLEALANVEGGDGLCLIWKVIFYGMVFMALMTFLDKPIMSFLEKHKATNSTKKKS